MHLRTSRLSAIELNIWKISELLLWGNKTPQPVLLFCFVGCCGSQLQYSKDYKRGSWIEWNAKMGFIDMCFRVGATFEWSFNLHWLWGCSRLSQNMHPSKKHVCVNIKIIYCQSNNFLTIKIVNVWDSLRKDPMQKGPLLWILHYSTYDVASQLAKLVSLKKIAHQSWFSKLPWHQTWFGRPVETMQWRENRIESSCAMKRKRDEFSVHAKGKLSLWCFCISDELIWAGTWGALGFLVETTHRI